MTSLTSMMDTPSSSPSPASAPSKRRAEPPRRADPLPTLLRQLIGRIGDPCTVERAVSRPWCSALFQGRRHALTIRLTGADALDRAQAFAAAAGEAQWSLPGHFLADIMVDDIQQDADSVGMTLSALAIEEW